MTKGEEYLKEESEVFKKLEEAGFTEEQIDAIQNYVEFRTKWLSDYREEVLKDVETLLRSEIREHSHLEGKVVKPF